MNQPDPDLVTENLLRTAGQGDASTRPLRKVFHWNIYIKTSYLPNGVPRPYVSTKN
jgi:hypothetical protein